MGRSVLVTGATGGIGGALVRAAATRGDHVLAAARPGPRLDALVGPNVTALPLDLTAPGPLPVPIDRLDAVVHAAGVADVAPVAETSIETWQRTMAVNLIGAAELTRALLPALRASRGHVVFVNAAPGVRGVPRWSAYGASKTALRELADTLREEEARLRVSTVYPGGTATPLLRSVRAAFGRPYDPAASIRPETLAAVILSILDAPPDAYLAEVSLLTRSSPSRGR
ncbi:SDR family oxidoreductase [Asanoa sp. NPDC049518]|uniref:SDR family oxidoreductase n=1 Tax=unclassified Asanoa TaxID=2685164 RepID=UPI0034270C71